MSTTRQLRFAFATPVAPAMTTLDRVTVRILESLARNHDEVWAPTTTIAARLGITVRAAQLRINRLVTLGLVRRVYNFGLRSRRALVLLWRQVTTCGEAMPPPDCAHSAHNPAPTEEPPLEPPYRNELNEKREPQEIVIVPADAGAEAGEEPPAVDPTTTNPCASFYHQQTPLGRALLSAGVPPEALHSPEKPATAVTIGEALAAFDPATRDYSRAAEPDPENGQRKATAAEVARVVTRFRKRFPQVQDPNRYVRTLAMRLRINGDRIGIEWVSDALDWADHKAARSPFYMATTLEDWAKNGHPGKPPEKKAAVMQNYNPPQPVDTSPPTAEALAGLERLAAGNGPVARLARAQLDRIRRATP